MPVGTDNDIKRFSSLAGAAPFTDAELGAIYAWLGSVKTFTDRNGDPRPATAVDLVEATVQTWFEQVASHERTQFKPTVRR